MKKKYELLILPIANYPLKLTIELNVTKQLLIIIILFGKINKSIL